MLLLCAFAASELYWFVLYAVTIWWPSASSSPVFWQEDCDDLIGQGNYRLIEGASWTFVSLAFLATLLLCVPVFGHRTESAAHTIVRALSLHRETRRTAFAPRPRGARGGGSGAAAGEGAQAAGRAGTRPEARRTASGVTHRTRRSGKSGGFEWTASTETWVKVGASLVAWTFWFIIVLVRPASSLCP